MASEVSAAAGAVSSFGASSLVKTHISKAAHTNNKRNDSHLGPLVVLTVLTA